MKDSELIWVDNNGNSKFAVYENKKVFRRNNITLVETDNDISYGTNVALTPNGQAAFVAANNSNIVIYVKPPLASTWIPGAVLEPSPVSSLLNTGFGNSISFDTAGNNVVIASYTASDVNSSGLSNQGFVEVYYKSTSVSWNVEHTVVSQVPVANEKFGWKAVLSDNKILAVSALEANLRGKVYIYKYSSNSPDGYYPFGSNFTGTTALDLFGYSLAISANGNILAVGAPGTNSNSGAVYIYKVTNTGFVLFKTINSSSLPEIQPSDQFGFSLDLTSDGSTLVVGSPSSDTLNLNSGKVYVFTGTNFDLQQVIFSNYKEEGEKFGGKVKFIDNTNLVVLAINGDTEIETTFDTYTGLLDGSSLNLLDPNSPKTESPTIFDNNTLRIIDIEIDSGRVDIYQKIANNFIFAETLKSDLDNTSLDAFGFSLATAKNNVLIGSPKEDGAYTDEGRVYSYSKLDSDNSWSIFYQETGRPNIEKIKKVFLYNKESNELSSYLDIVDPLQGKIPGPAEQELSFKTYFDPAVYTSSTVDGVIVDEGINWSSRQVGTLWWDLTRAKFLENGFGDTVYRNTTWNRLYETASIDIYEWVESKYKPSEWDEIAATDRGPTIGITGTSKYGNSAYSVKKRYDKISKTFQNTYYYWVKNPSIAPAVTNRKLSAYAISRLIADPTGQGYSCFILTGSNSYSLANVESIISSKDHNLLVQFWDVDKAYTEINAHSQWKILSEHPNTIIPPEIEKKWIHSLIGKDDSNRIVPDLKLPFKKRYGIGPTPRQSMFVNRIEALKQFIERVNDVLSKKLIADDYDLSDLFLFNSPPSAVSGIWDLTIDTDEELRFIGTATLQRAEILPVIVDGRIVDVEIIKSGQGYVNPPVITISKTGKGAILKPQINALGQITSVDIIEKGEGYRSSTTLSVRPFTVLVLSDSQTFDKWSTHYWDFATLTWERKKGQSFDVRQYWNYIDWYEEGYDQFTKIDHVVENTYELAVLESNIGNVVKVNNIGTGGWILLKQFNNLKTIDYTQNFSVVGRNNGTIKFRSNLYDYSSSGFDSTLFDANVYDSLADRELRIIINTIKEKLLVDELRVEYLKLFFSTLRYVLHEQSLVDWIMKTSFVKATHNVGNLKQKVNYNSDNLENYEDYVKEVKPYRTQIREYVSSYQSLDTAKSSVTDFDILPVIDDRLNISPLAVRLNGDGGFIYQDAQLETYPWKHWLDNVGFKVIEIKLIDGGSGYIDNPIVRIEGGYGSGATAKAFIANGKVNRIQLITEGTGYLKAPTIVIDGGLSVGGQAATASAIIETEVVRANKISIKFDRITRNYYVTEITETETFTGTGSKLQFPLKFSPETAIGTSQVLVNGIDVLRDNYKLSTKTSTLKGFTSYSGLLTLEVAPEVGETIEITYRKNYHHLSAADRINFYYNPTTGMYGKDLAQLMTGIDYGGVNITGLGFNVSGGWDSLPWFTDSWDGFDAAFDDYIVTVSDSTYSFTLPFTPSLGEKINVYVNGQRIDDPYFDLYDGSTLQPNGKTIAPPNTYMQTIIGDGLTKTYNLPNLTNNPPLDINQGDKIIFRRQTSDGSIAPLPGEYDTQLSGGDLPYTTATGLAPDDIILDGDKFVTPMTSHAPEEIVPGQITDALAIKVFQLPTSASAKVSFLNYLSDGVSTEFSLGQIPSNKASIFVSINGILKNQTLDYTINWKEQKIILNSPVSAGTVVSVITLGAAGQEILDTNYFIADGSTLEYVTDASYLDNNVNVTSAIVLVNGEPVNFELFRTNEGYESPGKVGIRFSEGFQSGDLITYMISGSDGQTASITKLEEYVGDGSTNAFTLQNQVGINQPHANSMIVLLNDHFQYPGSSEYFDLKEGILEYNLSGYKVQEYRADPADFEVYLDGVKLTYGSEYFFNTSVVSVVLKDAVYKEGGRLTVTNYFNSQYRVINGQVVFKTTPEINWRIKIYTFYNHNVLDIERTLEFTNFEFLLNPSMVEYYQLRGLKNGHIRLPRMVAADDYVWLVRNNKLLSHSIDYYLDSDLRTVKMKQPLTSLDGEVQVILLSDRVVNHSWGYMQFKDMLNRTHYKRISKLKTTRLARDLLQTDREIQVVDGSRLSPPNPALNLPGIVEINGERIEFFAKDGNVLSQLRRGTLGTGVPNVHRIRTNVMDIGPTETIPYVDNQLVETSVSDGSSNTVLLNYVPKKTNSTWYTQTIPAGYGRADDIDVFVGGYRLKKNDYKLFKESNGYPYSPEGDSQFEAEFSVDGTSNAVRITTDVPENTRIVVVKRQGRIWNPEGTDLTYHNGDIARFIRNTEAVFSQYLVDKYQYVLATDEGLTLLGDDSEPLELD